MKNIEIRDSLKENRIYSYELAAALGISETSLSRKLARNELPEEEKAEMLLKVNQLRNEERRK